MRISLMFVVAVLLSAALTGSAQRVRAQSGQPSQSPLAVDLEVSLPTPLRPGSVGSVQARLRNTLRPRDPIQLVAIATFEFNGQTYTATSNAVTLRVVQPVDIKQFNLRLPPGVTVGGDVTLPIQLNLSLEEGQEHRIQIPIRVQ